ncbi:hypothetical protein GGR51DRAFT_564341 [Nemania sp. FL0031]|nr:hypothetical protein GGR51DRAFT_564341 [Nemania sp. FL0031]
MPTTMSSGYSMFVEGPGKPIEGSGEPIEGPVKPIEGPGESIEGPGESIEDPSEPIEEADESIEEADESIKDPTEPIEKADERTLPIRVDGEMLMLMGMMQGIGRELLRKNVDDRSSTIEPEDVNQVTEMDYEDVNQVTEMDYEAWRVINYRRYHSKWCDADYMMPNDDRANTFLDKMDLCILSLQRSVGISSPYGTTMGGPSPERILDLGTGTGLWAWYACHLEVSTLAEKSD